MKRGALALFTLALVVSAAWPVSEAIGAASVSSAVAKTAESPLCRELTASRMLEHPALSQEWAEALKSAQPEDLERIRAMLAEIRAAHGCSGEIAMPAPGSEAPALPPGHPPLPAERGLPQGHPPIPSSPRAPLFEAPSVYQI